MDVPEHNDFINVGKEETAIGKRQSLDPKKYLSLDGNSLTIADLVRLGKGLFNIKLTYEAEGKINEAREVIETIIKENRVVYGVNTGFGKFAHTLIPKDKLIELQVNLIRSHSAGVGTPLSVERTRMLLALRINVLAKGYSGVSMETVQAMVKAFKLPVPFHCELVCSALPDIHAVRPHPGQIEVALRLRSLLHSDVFPSQISDSHRTCDRVQDAYTLRCIPQVHGVVNDTIAFVKSILTTELNSATDNPLVFAERGETISGGNFHGEYPAKALDYLAIGVHELASMSERRTERLVNPSLSELPAFLVQDGGLNSGFMIAHCTAAALVSESKALCHPSSVDSLSTSAATEDHVSMGGWAARKALRVVEHVEQVLAIELLAACQALEFLRPLKSTTPLEKVHELVRTVVRPWDHDRQMSPDIEAAHTLLREEKVWEAARPYMDQYRDRLGLKPLPLND
nr:histidine ammonia-lyase-like [Salvelinus alpinus]